MSAPKLTREQIEEALRLREQRGWSYERIGRRFDVSSSCISWHCLCGGADAPKLLAKPLPQTARGPAQYVRRDGVVVRRFTPEEDALLIAFDAQGLGPSEMGRRLKRTHNCCIGRLRTLARHAERAAAALAVTQGAPL